MWSYIVYKVFKLIYMAARIFSEGSTLVSCLHCIIVFFKNIFRWCPTGLTMSEAVAYSKGHKAILFKIVQRSDDKTFEVNTIPKIPGESVVNYYPGVYKVFKEGVVL